MKSITYGATHKETDESVDLEIYYEMCSDGPIYHHVELGRFIVNGLDYGLSDSALQDIVEDGFSDIVADRGCE